MNAICADLISLTFDAGFVLPSCFASGFVRAHWLRSGGLASFGRIGFVRADWLRSGALASFGRGGFDQSGWLRSVNLASFDLPPRNGKQSYDLTDLSSLSRVSIERPRPVGKRKLNLSLLFTPR